MSAEKARLGLNATVVLRDLIARGLICVEVVFPVKATSSLDMASKRYGSPKSWYERYSLEDLRRSQLLKLQDGDNSALPAGCPATRDRSS